MKNPVRHVILLALAICCSFVINSCKEDDELPPITMEGKHTFGCMVNGKLWQPRGSFNVPRVTADYSARTLLAIRSNSRDAIFIFYVDAPILVDHTYSLADTSQTRVYYTEGLDGEKVCHYEAQDVTQGNLIFSRFDETNSVLSGTFEFNSISIDCNRTINVTDGRFDIAEITF